MCRAERRHDSPNVENSTFIKISQFQSREAAAELGRRVDDVDHESPGALQPWQGQDCRGAGKGVPLLTRLATKLSVGALVDPRRGCVSCVQIH